MTEPAAGRPFPELTREEVSQIAEAAEQAAADAAHRLGMTGGLSCVGTFNVYAAIEAAVMGQWQRYRRRR